MQKFPFKNGLSLTIEYTECTSSFFRNLVASVCSKQAKSADPQWRKLIPLERQFHSKKLSFFHKKEAEHSFELALSICVLYLRIFNREIQKFSLEKRGGGGLKTCLWWTIIMITKIPGEVSTPLHLPYRYLSKIRSRVRIWRAGQHTPTTIYQELPPPPPPLGVLPYTCLTGIGLKLLVFSITPFKIDQNKKQNPSIDKFQNLGNERRKICKDPRQGSGRRNISYTRVSKR